MRFIRKYWQLMMLSFVLWLLLNSSLSVYVLITGFFASFFTAWLMQIIQKDHSSARDYSISVPVLIQYVFQLLIENYKSAFQVCLYIFQNKVNPQFVTVNTHLEKPWIKSILGNSITLTPGTVTVDMSDQTYTVLWLYPLAAKEKGKEEHITLAIEKVLEKEA